MSDSFELSIEVSEPYRFAPESLERIGQNTWVKNQWPLVYFMWNKEIMQAYVGETANALNRIKNHLANSRRQELNMIHIVGSDKFNKSATLDIESKLIQYITGEGTWKLQNGNFGQVGHTYYQQDLYKDLFKEVWNKLTEKKIVTKSLQEIENSELFKYSPYKTLNEDQYSSVLEILKNLTEKQASCIFVSGSAGTGKTILATYLMKLLVSDIEDVGIEEYNDDELREVHYIGQFRKRYPKLKIGLVVAMTSLRESLQNVFRKIPGLKASMILSPSDTFKEKYDLLIVDEAHRLRQYRNIGWMGAFKKNNKKLGLDDSGTELDWILANSSNQIFFYDAAQSVKPSDVDGVKFQNLLNKRSTVKLELKSQMRVEGKSDYIQFVDQLLNCRIQKGEVYEDERYDLLLFDSFSELHGIYREKEEKFGLCRMIAGYSWPWLSDPKKDPRPGPNVMDIELDGLKFRWNSTDKDWVNSPNAPNEIGCIHTTQGYDLNYAVVIFGWEVDYNFERNCIEIDPEKYFDNYGKKGIDDKEVLRAYVVNIYKTLMYRGIKGTYIYACNENLRRYLKLHIKSYEQQFPFRVIKGPNVKPFVNAIPFIDISVAAGEFSPGQPLPDNLRWVEAPFNIAAKQGYFICKVVGESMNRRIPNGSYCLFRTDPGGTRNGKIVLVQSSDIQDPEFGSGYTVKEYHSEKQVTEEGWRHERIILRPLSNDSKFRIIELDGDEDSLRRFRVLGIFDRVLR